MNPPRLGAKIRENLDPLLPVGRIGHDERAIGSGREGNRAQDPAGLDADLQELPRAALAILRDAIHGMPPPVEDQIVIVRRDVAGGDLFEGAGDVSREARRRRAMSRAS